MRLPRIAVLCAISGLGGAEFSLLELVTRLRDDFEFHLIVPGEGPLRERAESAGAKVWLMRWPDAITATGEIGKRVNPAGLLRSAAELPAFARKLSSLLEEIDASALVTNAVKAHLVGALALRRKQLPLFWYMRDGMEERALSRRLLSLLSRRCDRAICISHYVEEQFRKYVSVSVPTDVIYNIVDLTRFRVGALPAADLPKAADEIWFGVIGAITPLKGLDIFLDAAQKVSERLLNARFLIVGSNAYETEKGTSYEQSLMTRVENSSLHGHVKFLGFRNDVPNVLARLDVLVQPNRGPEGLGRSVIEAMACAVPVIAVNRWGPAELIQQSCGGQLFQPLDTGQLASQMITMGESDSLRRIMGKQGHDWVQRNLLPKELADNFRRTLEKTMFSSTHGKRQEVAA
jgi:glycosyltransferase involved in cell wall biosynthesis